MQKVKIHWRCIEDKFGYCSGEPDWDVEPHIVKDRWGTECLLIGGKCKRDPIACKKYQTIKESLAARDKEAKNND